MTANNNDTGSLKVGKEGINLKVGDKIRIVGEDKTRTISYIMGKEDRTHICCKGCGPFPIGEVQYEVVS